MKLRDVLYITVLIPRVYMLDWTQTPSEYLDLYITQSSSSFSYIVTDESMTDFEYTTAEPGENCECVEE